MRRRLPMPSTRGSPRMRGSLIRSPAGAAARPNHSPSVYQPRGQYTKTTSPRMSTPYRANSPLSSRNGFYIFSGFFSYFFCSTNQLFEAYQRLGLVKYRLKGPRVRLELVVKKYVVMNESHFNFILNQV